MIDFEELSTMIENNFAFAEGDLSEEELSKRCSVPAVETSYH